MRITSDRDPHVTRNALSFERLARVESNDEADRAPFVVVARSEKRTPWKSPETLPRDPRSAR